MKITTDGVAKGRLPSEIFFYILDRSGPRLQLPGAND